MQRQDHEIYLGVEDATKQLIVKAYAPCTGLMKIGRAS